MTGVSYTGAITSGLILRYRRALIPALPVTVTFQAQVAPNAFPVIVNAAWYGVDVPYTTVMVVTAEVEHAVAKMYLPLIKK